MKRIFAVFLAAALFLSAGCNSRPEAEPTASPTMAATAEPTSTPAPTQSATPEPTAEPTIAPTDTPAPTAAPLKDTVTDADLNGVARPGDSQWLKEAAHGTVTAGYMLALHWGPSMDYNECGVVYKGDVLTVLAEDNGWLLVKTQDGRYGWASDAYVEVTDAAPAETAPSAAPTTVPLGEDSAPAPTMAPLGDDFAPAPTAAPVVQQPANGGAPPAAPPAAPTVAPCQHEWVTETVVDQPEVGHFGPIDPNLPYPSYVVLICRCGAEFTTGEALNAHQQQWPPDDPERNNHAGDTTGVRSNQQWIVDQPEITHTVTRCTKCGATQ